MSNKKKDVFPGWAWFIIAVIAFYILVRIFPEEDHRDKYYPCKGTGEDFADCTEEYYKYKDYDPGDSYDYATDYPDVPEEYYAEPGIGSSSCPSGCTTHPAGCDIKGNIGYNTGEKIYHVPGQEYYNDTKISPDYGERWFCTEAEAIANGWRKSKQ